MLGRLKMDIDQCIAEYSRLCRHVFGRKKRLSLTMAGMSKRKAKHDRRKLEVALKGVLREMGYEDREILMQDVDLSCRVYVSIHSVHFILLPCPILFPAAIWLEG